jgi:hypothetical protein
VHYLLLPFVGVEPLLRMAAHLVHNSKGAEVLIHVMPTAGEVLVCSNVQVTNAGNVRLSSISPHASAGTVACNTALLAVDASTVCSLTVNASQNHFEAGFMSSMLRVTAAPLNAASTVVAGNYTATVQLMQAPVAVVSIATNITIAHTAGELPLPLTCCCLPLPQYSLLAPLHLMCFSHSCLKHASDTRFSCSTSG